jgi:hypothetical protein
MRSKRWQDLTERQRWVISALSAAQFALLGAALRDIHRRPVEELRGSRRLWTLVVFVNFVGPIVYFLLGRRGPSEQDRTGVREEP